MDPTPRIQPLGQQEPLGPTSIDVNRALVDLALAELAAVTEGQPGKAAGLAEAQGIIRRHAGIPTGADV